MIPVYPRHPEPSRHILRPRWVYLVWLGLAFWMGAGSVLLVRLAFFLITSVV